MKRCNSLTNKNFITKRCVSDEIKGVKLPEENKMQGIPRKVMIKSKSIGDTNISIKSRLAIVLYVDKKVNCCKFKNEELPICIWINGDKLIGWNIDYIAERLKIIKNSKEEKKLTFYKQNKMEEGMELKMSLEVRKCIKDEDTLYITYS